MPAIDHVFVQPAASDRGVSRGCALHGAVESGDNVVPMHSASLGRAYDPTPSDTPVH